MLQIKQVCQRYNVDEKVLKELSENSIVGRKIDESYQFDDDDICKLGEILFLKTVGLSQDDIFLFYKMDEQGRERLLKKERQSLLDDVHQNEKKIAQIDCYLFNLKEKGERK